MVPFSGWDSTVRSKPVHIFRSNSCLSTVWVRHMPAGRQACIGSLEAELWSPVPQAQLATCRPQDATGPAWGRGAALSACSHGATPGDGQEGGSCGVTGCLYRSARRKERWHDLLCLMDWKGTADCLLGTALIHPHTNKNGVNCNTEHQVQNPS